jgi:hypothetical protein
MILLWLVGFWEAQQFIAFCFWVAQRFTAAIRPLF